MSEEGWNAAVSGNAIREICLNKLVELFSQMFSSYTEDKSVVTARARSYSSQLEKCMMNVYSESEASGSRYAGVKYG